MTLNPLLVMKVNSWAYISPDPSSFKVSWMLTTYHEETGKSVQSNVSDHELVAVLSGLSEDTKVKII